MKTHAYRILTGAALAMFVGIAGAQTYGNQPSAAPADKNTQSQTTTPSDSSMAPKSDTSSNMQAPSGSNPNARLPANRGATENTPAQSEPSKTTDKISGQPQTGTNTDQGSKMSENKTKTTHHAHATKRHGHPQQAAVKGDKAYQDALRSCAKEQDQSARDKCLDNAIEQFHRNT